MTYSITARDPQTGAIGVAVQSHYFGAGRVVTWAEAGVGAVATQSVPEVGYGPRGLDGMRAGASASSTLADLVAKDPMAALRQVAMIDARGDVAVHTGSSCIAEAGHATANQMSAQANMMEKPTVWGAMAKAFEASAARNLPWRLLIALEAAEREGGDIRGRQSAAMLVVSGERSEAPWDRKLVDLRVDDHPEPLVEMRRLLETHEAFERLSRVFQSGVLFAPGPPDPGVLARLLAELDATQRTLGDNREPTFWQAMLLAKAGRIDEARARLRAACETNARWVELMRRLVPSGILPADEGVLARLRP
jgi:uncharacterized Ntn-hydrolase superfamily protein